MAGKAESRKVIFRGIAEAARRVSALQAQEVDIIENLPPHLIPIVNWKGRSYVLKALELKDPLSGL